MSRSAQNVVSSPVKPSTETLGRPPTARRSMASRSSAVNSRCLDWLTPTATTTSSKSDAARSTMSRCPLVTGSNDPGQTARRTGPPRGPSGTGWDRLHVGGVNVPEHGLAVLLLPAAGEALGPQRLGRPRSALDDHHRARDEPALVVLC